MKFVKYHGLGNDYIVIEPQEFSQPPAVEQIRQVCDRHYGPGSDGILLGPLPSTQADFGVRIFNPDGSEAEKSGNGLRIFSRYLWDHGYVSCQGSCSTPFLIETAGGVVKTRVLENGKIVTIEMGQASFDSQRIPVIGPQRQVLDERMNLGGEELRYCAVTLGNPHCVIICEQVSEALARRLGPLVESEARFPRRTNVQFLKVLGRDRLQIEIWERGAGYTLASGSSSCAAAAAAYQLGLCERNVAVQMPGGVLQITINADLGLTMTGPVEKVYEGRMD